MIVIVIESQCKSCDRSIKVEVSGASQVDWTNQSWLCPECAGF